MIREVTEAEFLAHYGILRKSGRYPWGSGQTQSIRNRTFLETVKEMERQGLTEAQIAKGLSVEDDEFTVNQLRALKSIAVNQQRQEKIRTAERLRDKGMSTSEIGRQMGANESTIRSWLDPSLKERADILDATADMLRKQVEEKGFVDVGAYTELDLPINGTNIGITSTKFKTALAILEEEGYRVHSLNMEQLGTGKDTRYKVLVKPGVTKRDVWDNRFNVKTITDYSEDGGRTYTGYGIKPPLQINSKRVAIRYAEEGGAKADGVIYVRPGVKDLSMGTARYAQVRIGVDGTHYLKGMAVYKDDLPDGVDLMFNTNKSDTGRKHDAMKDIKDDPDNPFGAVIRQIHDEKGNLKSALNLVGVKEGAGEEGYWDSWTQTLPSQFLSKQEPDLAREQLNFTRKNRHDEYADIMELTNPVIRRKLLEEFADATDSSAVHLEAAAMPRQASRVLLPINSVKPTEVYAPGFRDGERVALVRFPHGGTFEIPELVVNNKNQEARKTIGNTLKTDAVGIHHSVAERLSGADFDGDAVLVIPNNAQRVKRTDALEGLKNFDPRQYKPYDGMSTIDGGTYNAKTGKVDYPKKGPNKNGKGTEMGKITNLIADMSIRDAPPEDLARAVRHSMVVIDSEKHVLDYKASAVQNGIIDLKRKYQGGSTAGASTIITRSTAETRVKERKQLVRVDPNTGEKIYTPTGRQYRDRKTGQLKDRTTISTKGAEAKDARELLSKNPTEMELLYAEHANAMKAMANTARKEAVNTKPFKRSPSATKVYAPQVESLKAQLIRAQKNAPLERQAQIIGNARYRQKLQANPNMDDATKRKIKNQSLTGARIQTGAQKTRVQISAEEWNAIQAGAISASMLTKIMQNTDMEALRDLAQPHAPTIMTTSKQQQAKQLLARGYTQAQVADQLGVNVNTLKSSLTEE